MLARHQQYNLETAGEWNQFAAHRARVTALVIASIPAAAPSSTSASAPPPPGRRLLVLGAGNCNDIDLVALLAKFETIHLVDVDRLALERAVASLDGEQRARIVLRAPVNLARGLTRDSSLPGRDQLPDDEKNFDVVLSACVLSQLVLDIAEAITTGEEALVEAIQGARSHHVRLMLSLLAPKGVGLLVSDMVSSDTVPDLASTPATVATMAKLVGERNFFTGMNPFLLEAGLNKEFAADIVRVEREDPWIWQLSATRSYLVFALRFFRR